MRTCPDCSTINSDNSLNCGVCGTGLSGVVSTTLEAAESVAKEQSTVSASQVVSRNDSSKSGVVGVLSGVILALAGIILFPFVSSLWPILLIIPGMVLILVGLDSLSRSPPLRSMFGHARAGGSGWRAMRREAQREAAEEKKVESGEAD